MLSRSFWGLSLWSPHCSKTGQSSVFVVAIVLFNNLLGFYQEYTAEKSLSALKSMTQGSAHVIRNGVSHIIAIDELVIGDVVLLEQGSCAPADLRLFSTNSMQVDESLLTGEAPPVTKIIDPIPDPKGELSVGDRKNMVFRPTSVTCGKGAGIVVAGWSQRRKWAP